LLAAQVAVGQVIELGGPRRVSVRVAAGKDGYRVTARLLPVAAFDEATNAALNRRRGEQYALTGLARHLAKDDRKAELVVTGARVVATERDGKFFVLILEVPAKGARLVRAGDPAVPEKARVRVRGLFDSKFFTLKRDLLDTARGVAW